MQADVRREILDQVQKIAGDILQLPDLTLNEQSTANDVDGWDSLTHVQIVVGVEQHFGIRFSFSEVAELENAGALVSAIQRHRTI